MLNTFRNRYLYKSHLDPNTYMHENITQTHVYDKKIVKRFEKTITNYFHTKNDDVPDILSKQSI